MTEIQQLIQELDSEVQQAGVLSYNTVSATALLLYEVIITFPDELRCIWLSSWSPITILHLLIRYYALGFLLVCSYVSINTNLSVSVVVRKFLKTTVSNITNFNASCGPFDIFQIWGAVALVPAVDILIVVRVFALYNQNKWIGAALIFCWLAETAVIFTLTALGFGPDQSAMPNPLPGIIPECTPTAPFNSRNLVIGGSAAMGLQGVYFGLALFKLIRQFKSFKVLTPLLETFYRDGALYCFNILAMYGVSVFFAQHYPPDTPLQGVGSPWLISIVTITAGRLVLNLRNSIHTTTLRTSIVTDESYELQFTTPRGSRQMSSTILLDTSQLPRIDINININDNTDMSMEIEPLPSLDVVVV